MLLFYVLAIVRFSQTGKLMFNTLGHRDPFSVFCFTFYFMKALSQPHSIFCDIYRDTWKGYTSS